ncbi:hypothetical protein [Stutzerimonas nitrititolerans]|uniref:hypothetical protein n=1 Tax=Stutzerimonas nitrititolerans TaxID=2482751 RepID=UPI0028A64F9A|nr:hypothetical protein [Stutzerimonas nitrititolerans]
MSLFSLTKGSEHALKLLALTGGNDTLLLIQPAREVRADISVQSAAERKLEAELRLREQRHSITLQAGDSANAQHLADWVEAIANGTLDTALAVPQQACTCPSGGGSLRWPCPNHGTAIQPSQAPQADMPLLIGVPLSALKEAIGILNWMSYRADIAPKDHIRVVEAGTQLRAALATTHAA